MNDRIATLIDEYEKPKDFSYDKPSDERVAHIESRLGLKIPSQYIEFMKQYGEGGILGIELFGIGDIEYLSLPTITLKFRKLGLPQNLVAIENCDEWLVCLDCDNGHVVNWSAYDGGEVLDVAPDFDTFLLDELENAIENR